MMSGKPDALIHHSDRGSQYTSDQFQRLMADHGVACSMSRSGNVWDHAAMESFFSPLKTERTARKIYRTRDEARANVLYRALVQHQASALDDRLSQSYGARNAGRIRLTESHSNQQLIHHFCNKEDERVRMRFKFQQRKKAEHCHMHWGSFGHGQNRE